MESIKGVKSIDPGQKGNETSALEPSGSYGWLNNGEYPLSAGQRALWSLQPFTLNGAAYNVVRAVEIDSDFGTSAFHEAWQIDTRAFDYVKTQARELAGSCGQESLQYWKGKLPKRIPVLNIPTDFQRPPVQTFFGDFKAVRWDESTPRDTCMTWPGSTIHLSMSC